jgi:hypothetical protein
VHRLLANLDKIDPDKIARVRSMEALVVDEAAMALPPPPAVPAGF